MIMVRKSGSFILSAVLLAVSASVALAQVRQIQMGVGMDANPQVGGGGSNQPVQGYVPINPNDVVTGNVSGLKYFHGQTAAPSSSQFGGSGGSSRSIVVNGSVVQQNQFGGNLGSSAFGGFARQSAGGQISGGSLSGLNQVYYLPSATVSTGGGSLYSAPVGSGFDSALVPSASISPAASSAQISAITQNASVEPQTINRALPANLIDVNSYAGPLSTPLFSLRLPDGTQKPELPGSTNNTDPSGKTNPPRTPGNASSGDNPDEQPKPNPAEVTGAVNIQDPRLRSQSTEVRTALVSDTFMKLAQELKAAQNLPATTDFGHEPKTSFGNNVADEIDPLTGLRRQIALLPPGKATEASLSAKSLADLSPNELTAGSKVKPVKLAAAIIANAPASDFELLMIRGENELKAGRYLDAAKNFQTALANKPEDPLALVGRAHAEFGAGLYAAAAYDLKFVFTRHSGMVAVKYDPQSFIPATRQEFLLDDLQKLTPNKDTGDMARFLYCYLCYETGRATALQTELKKWNATEGHDTWATVATKAWGGAK